MSRNKHVFKDKRGPALLWITTPSPYQRNNLQIIALLLLADSELRVGSRGGSSPEKRCCWLARVNTLAKSPNLPPPTLSKNILIKSVCFNLSSSFLQSQFYILPLIVLKGGHRRLAFPNFCHFFLQFSFVRKLCAYFRTSEITSIIVIFWQTPKSSTKMIFQELWLKLAKVKT